MTIQEIWRVYPSEWILIGDPKTDDRLTILEGVVLHHSPDRDEVYNKAIELRPRRSAFLFTGRLPKGLSVVL
jgi:hypothetical protein